MKYHFWDEEHKQRELKRLDEELASIDERLATYDRMIAACNAYLAGAMFIFLALISAIPLFLLGIGLMWLTGSLWPTFFVAPVWLYVCWRVSWWWTQRDQQ